MIKERYSILIIMHFGQQQDLIVKKLARVQLAEVFQSNINAVVVIQDLIIGLVSTSITAAMDLL